MERPVRKFEADYSVFISKGFVSLPGLDKCVAVTILRDSGALNSFVLESTLPFSADTDTGEVVVARGMGLIPFFASVHKMHLKFCLVTGDVTVAIRPELPVNFILGNDLAVVEPEGFPPCAVIQAMAKNCSDQPLHMGRVEANLAVFVPTLLQSIPPVI